MNQKIYQVDAFTNKVFGGNPAAVCPLDNWLSDEVMQNIAMENNLAETAFYVKQPNHYELRWFTPAVEVDLCGHATLAAAHVLFHNEGYQGEMIRFMSPRSGELTVKREGKQLTLNFPKDIYEDVPLLDVIVDGFNIKPKAVLKGKTDYVFVYDSEEEILKMNPDFGVIKKLDCRGIIATSPGNDVDFVSRF
ncbi:MAG: PhzF family phenazine biosynthesis protein, partial [Flavobacteriaceae bacterium]|nr:PhzF family phenazine biosynthesis protein [Flavobacteriaceae bacterium]